MAIDSKVLKDRITAIRDGLYKTEEEGRKKADFERLEGNKQATLTLLQVVYGTDSLQVSRFTSEYSPLGHEQRNGYNDARYVDRVARLVDNVLETAAADIDAGLVTSIASSAKGEVLGDLAALARTILGEGDPNADRAAAVLAAAALEDTLKQLGDAKGVPVSGRELRGTITKLKDAGVLGGPQAAVANGFIDFRNKALHGELEHVERESTLAVLGFVETVILKHFT